MKLGTGSIWNSWDPTGVARKKATSVEARIHGGGNVPATTSFSANANLQEGFITDMTKKIITTKIIAYLLKLRDVQMIREKYDCMI